MKTRLLPALARSRFRQFGGPFGSTLLILAFAHAREGFRGRWLWVATLVALGLAVAAGRAQSERNRVFLWTLGGAFALAASHQTSPWFGLVGGAVGYLFASQARRSVRHETKGLAGSGLSPPRGGQFALVVVWALAVATFTAQIWRPGSVLGALSASSIVWALLASFAIVAFDTLRLWRATQLALDVPPRALVTLTACAAGGLITVLSLMDRQPDVEHVATLALATVAWLTEWAWGTGDGAKVARRGRRAAALGLVGGAVVMLGALAATGNTSMRWILVVATGGIALAIGASVEAVEEPFLPESGLWLTALRRAYETICERDPEDAIFAALETLRTAFGPKAPSPQIWTMSPPRVTTIDMAGYIHEQEGELPDIVPVASDEVAATLRTEVLLAREVRRPELRPLLAWMNRERATTATVITHNGQPQGLLLLPETGRPSRITLEEVLAAKRLADALAFACQQRARQASATARIVETEARAELAEAAVEAFETRRRQTGIRNAHTTRLLAQAADTGTYSAAARFAMDALVAAAERDKPAVVVAPIGSHPSAWAAHAHLLGARRDGPFIVVECTRSAWHDADEWDDAEASPLALANGGTLCLVDVRALPQSIQEKIAACQATRRAPWNIELAIDVQLVVTAAERADERPSSGHLHPELVKALGDAVSHAVSVPTLDRRPEDMRALVTERLARAGLRWKGAPSGIDAPAFARLVQHHFDGGEDELTTLIERAVAATPGDVVTRQAIEAVIGDGRSKAPNAPERKDRAK